MIRSGRGLSTHEICKFPSSPLQPAMNRSFTDSECAGDVGVRHFAEIVQNHEFPHFGIQLVDGDQKGRSPWLQTLGNHSGRINAERNDWRTTMVQSQGDPATNGSQPMRKSFRISQCGQLTSGHRKGFLGGVFGQMAVPSQAKRDSDRHPPVPLEENSERLHLSLEGGGDQL